MKHFLVSSAALCCMALSGCVVPGHHGHPTPRATRVVVPAPAVVVPVPVVVENAPAKHCPPGQAKKGKC